MPLMSEDFSEAKTTVFWDVEDFPNPNDGSISEKIKSALANEGYHGEIVSIKAYGEEKPENLNLDDSRITFAPRRGKCARLKKMVLEIALWALPLEDSRSEPQNLMVIAKNIPEKTNFMFSLNMLQRSSWNCNVLFVLADDCAPEETPFLSCASKIWFWESLLNGGKALNEDILDSLIARMKPNPVDLPQADNVGGFFDESGYCYHSDFVDFDTDDACPYCKMLW